MNIARKVLAATLILASSITGCDSDYNKNTRQKEQAQPTSSRSSNDEENLETKLKKLDVFYIPKSDASKLVDLTRDALNENKGALQKLDEIVSDSYGKKPLIVKISTTWCGPCRASQKDFVEFALKHDDIKAVHLIADKEIVGADVMAGLSLAYDFNYSVPSYLVLDIYGKQVGERPSQSLEDALDILKNPPEKKDYSDEDRERTLVLARDFVQTHSIPIDADQVTVINGSTSVKNNYELLEFLAEQTGEGIEWNSELEKLARDSYTYLDKRSLNAKELLEALEEELYEWDKGGEFNPLCELVSNYKKRMLFDEGSFYTEQATAVKLKDEEKIRLLYDTNDFFDLIQEKTGLEIKASKDVFYRPILFSTHGGSLSYGLCSMFIENERRFKARMYDLGEGRNPILILQRNKK